MSISYWITKLLAMFMLVVSMSVSTPESSLANEVREFSCAYISNINSGAEQSLNTGSEQLNKNNGALKSNNNDPITDVVTTAFLDFCTTIYNEEAFREKAWTGVSVVASMALWEKGPIVRSMTGYYYVDKSLWSGGALWEAMRFSNKSQNKLLDFFIKLADRDGKELFQRTLIQIHRASGNVTIKADHDNKPFLEQNDSNIIDWIEGLRPRAE